MRFLLQNKTMPTLAIELTGEKIQYPASIRRAEHSIKAMVSQNYASAMNGIGVRDIAKYCKAMIAVVFRICRYWETDELARTYPQASGDKFASFPVLLHLLC